MLPEVRDMRGAGDPAIEQTVSGETLSTCLELGGRRALAAANYAAACGCGTASIRTT